MHVADTTCESERGLTIGINVGCTRLSLLGNAVFPFGAGRGITEV
jgi:hypothetical protein